jgi:PAS domain S-box-containing protein
MLISTPSGERIPLSRLASVEIVEGPSTITREWGQRRITITANVRGRDLGSFVAEARAKITENVSLPSARYRLEYGGQFENLQRAQTRLMIVVPLALVLIFVLLYLTYHSIVDALRVFTGIPFAWVGGILALWLRDMPFSISAGIGFIAMSGVAVLDDGGEVQALEGLIIDMTPERETFEALDLALAEWQQVFDAMDDSVMVLDADGVVVRANAATATLTGLRMEAIVGARCCEVFHGLSTAHPDCPRDRALRSGHAETSVIKQDDRLLRFTFKPAPVLDGRVSGGIHVVSDVSDLVEPDRHPELG